MNWEAIGAVGEILGAFAVFVSLIYLATQIRSSTNQSKAMMVHNLTSEFGDLHNVIMENPQFAELLAKSRHGENLTAGEKTQIYSFANKIFNIYAAATSAYENKQIPAEVYHSVIQNADLVRRRYPNIAKMISVVIADHSELSQKEIFKRFLDSDEPGQ